MFQDDSEFARLRVQGPNCMLITAIRDALPSISRSDAAKYASIVNGDTLAAALADGRLFILDYKPLEVLDPGTYGTMAKYAWQPIALFAIPPGGSSLDPRRDPVRTGSRRLSDRHPFAGRRQDHGAGKWQSSSCRSPTAITMSCLPTLHARIW